MLLCSTRRSKEFKDPLCSLIKYSWHQVVWSQLQLNCSFPVCWEAFELRSSNRWFKYSSAEETIAPREEKCRYDNSWKYLPPSNRASCLQSWLKQSPGGSNTSTFKVFFTNYIYLFYTIICLELKHSEYVEHQSCWKEKVSVEFNINLITNWSQCS